jgi:hypothetical protein
VLRLIFALVDIMLHRRGPDSLPSSPFLFWFLFALMITTTLALRAVDELTALGIVVAVLVAGLEIWFVWAVLRAFGRERRFRQAMGAVFGTDAMINVLMIPFIPFALPPSADGQQLSFAWLALAMLEVWSIDIMAFVLSRALDRPYLLTLAIVIAYVLLIASLQITLLSRPA